MNRLWFGIFAACLFAQDQPVFRADSNLVAVPVVVTDAKGAPVRDLKLEDFRLYDNGAPREIRRLSLQAELPLALVMVVDLSVSQASFLVEHASTVGTFVDRLLHRDGDRAFLFEVHENVVLRDEFVVRSKRLSSVVLPRGGEMMREACPPGTNHHYCGGTLLWDGIYLAIQSKLGAFAGSKALIVLSDGNDNGSKHTLDEALEEVRRSGTVVYVVRYPDRLSDIRDNGLSHLAAESGGAEFEYDTLKYAALDRVQTDLRSQYVLSFYPEIRDNANHTLRVETVRPGLTVRSRREYFASEK